MKLYMVYQIYSVYAKRMMTFKISTQDGTNLSQPKVNTYGNGPGRFAHVKLAGFCPASDCIGSV